MSRWKLNYGNEEFLGRTASDGAPKLIKQILTKGRWKDLLAVFLKGELALWLDKLRDII